MSQLAVGVFFGAWGACIASLGYALYNLVLLVRGKRAFAADAQGGAIPPELFMRRRRAGAAVIVFVVAWAVGWGMPLLLPHLLGLE